VSSEKVLRFFETPRRIDVSAGDIAVREILPDVIEMVPGVALTNKDSDILRVVGREQDIRKIR